MLRGVVEQQGSTMFPQPVNLLINFKPAIQVKSQSQLIKSNWNVSPPPPLSGWAWKEIKLTKNPVFLLMSLISDTTSEYEMSEFSIVAALHKKIMWLFPICEIFVSYRSCPPAIPREKKSYPHGEKVKN